MRKAVREGGVEESRGEIYVIPRDVCLTRFLLLLLLVFFFVSLVLDILSDYVCEFWSADLSLSKSRRKTINAATEIKPILGFRLRQ